MRVLVELAERFWDCRETETRPNETRDKVERVGRSWPRASSAPYGVRLAAPSRISSDITMPTAGEILQPWPLSA